MSNSPSLDGIIPAHLAIRSSSILLDSLEVVTDIGFHEFEVGAPQRLLVTVEIILEDIATPENYDPANAWDYDYLRRTVNSIEGARRWNLQETLAREIYERFAALAGVKGLRVALSKPDIYPDALGVGVEIASFTGPRR